MGAYAPNIRALLIVRLLGPQIGVFRQRQLDRMAVRPLAIRPCHAVVDADDQIRDLLGQLDGVSAGGDGNVVALLVVRFLNFCLDHRFCLLLSWIIRGFRPGRPRLSGVPRERNRGVKIPMGYARD